MANNIIEALRCSVSAGNHDCVNCPWSAKERLDDFPELKSKIPHDAIIDGVAYWISCDVERIALEAADELERLTDGK